jgi:hypothetical protein
VAYQRAASARPSFGDAWWSLANLKTYRFSTDEIAQMRKGEGYHLCFALGRALEDRKEFAESWKYYERGNALKRAESRYHPEITENDTRQQMETYTKQLLAARDGAGAPDPDPIFIVGLHQMDEPDVAKVVRHFIDEEWLALAISTRLGDVELAQCAENFP